MTTQESSIEALQTTIASLRVQWKERQGIGKQLSEAEEELNFRLATVFVVVESEELIKVYGVRKEVSTRANGLHMALRGQMIHITQHYNEGSTTLFLAPGGQISGVLSQSDGSEHRPFRILAFANMELATEWAKKRQEEILSTYNSR